MAARNAATAVRYGPAERALQVDQARATQQGTDVAGWYDAYRRELQQHTANTQAINAQATQQIQQTGAGLRGLDQAQSTQQPPHSSSAAECRSQQRACRPRRPSCSSRAS